MFKSRASKSAEKAAKTKAFKQEYFNSCHRTYSCIHCRAHLANHDELISKLFQGNHGRAYLFNKVTNIGTKQAVQRELLTGPHAVADIYCDSCETTLGWKYEQAYVPSQKYKEGKYIIELVHMLKENDWDLTSYNARDLLNEEERREFRQDYWTCGSINDGLFVGSANGSVDRIKPKEVVSFYNSNLNGTLAAAATTTTTNTTSDITSQTADPANGNSVVVVNRDLESSENQSPEQQHNLNGGANHRPPTNRQLETTNQTASKTASPLATGILELEMLTSGEEVRRQASDSSGGGDVSESIVLPAETGGAPMVAVAPLAARNWNATM